MFLLDLVCLRQCCDISFCDIDVSVGKVREMNVNDERLIRIDGLWNFGNVINQFCNMIG